jgi:hypothetical protein
MSSGAAMGKADEQREKSLADALRENLRRRKAQARDNARPGNGEREQPKTGGGGPAHGK